MESTISAEDAADSSQVGATEDGSVTEKQKTDESKTTTKKEETKTKGEEKKTNEQNGVTGVTQRPNISTPTTSLIEDQYNKFADIDVSSDEDDCHPNIELNTWRRLKERMRAEKGIVKREPLIFDKYNTTQVNTKKTKYDITGQGNDDTHNDNDNDNDDANEDANNNGVSTLDSNGNDNDNDNASNGNATHNNNNNNNNNNNSKSKQTNESKTDENSEQSSNNDSNNVQQAAAAAAAAAGPAPKPQGKSNSKSKSGKQNGNNKSNEKEANLFEARSDPKVFLDEYLPLIKKFAKMKNNDTADEFLRKNYDLVHEATEGYIITFAVDRAVEGASKKQLQKYARRCLTIHNLIQSCQSANVAPQVGVTLFFSKMQDKAMKQMYLAELEKQVNELLGRIEIRRKERIAEAEALNEEDLYNEEKAPLGPGGLDPTEVLNQLPKKMQEAFVSRDVDMLKQVLRELPIEDAQKYMKMCVDSGLWVDNNEEEQDDIAVDTNVDGYDADIGADADAEANEQDDAVVQN